MFIFKDRLIRNAALFFILLGAALITFNVLAEDTGGQYQDIDIHLSVSDKIKDQIEEFNSYLSKSGILKKYNITPFLKDHPVHITLYLADFDVGKLEEIKAEVKQIAARWKKFEIKTTGIEASKSGYVMLEVNNEKDKNGDNNKLQTLSDEVIFNLMEYRDKQAEAPGWVKAFPGKEKSFNLYGTPNAFMEFSAHCSILAESLTNPDQQAAFFKEMDELVKNYDYKSTEAEVLSIGIGYVDEFGQMTKEIGDYPLI